MRILLCRATEETTPRWTEARWVTFYIPSSSSLDLLTVWLGLRQLCELTRLTRSTTVCPSAGSRRWQRQGRSSGRRRPPGRWCEWSSSFSCWSEVKTINKWGLDWNCLVSLHTSDLWRSRQEHVVAREWNRESTVREKTTITKLFPLWN